MILSAIKTKINMYVTSIFLNSLWNMSEDQVVLFACNILGYVCSLILIIHTFTLKVSQNGQHLCAYYNYGLY